MKLVVIESPLAGDVDANVAYARRAVADSLKRGESPYASHLFFPQVLDDLKQERSLGIAAGLAWGDKADQIAVYADRGLSRGMLLGLEHHSKRGVRIDIRWLNDVAISTIEAVRAEVEKVTGYRAKILLCQFAP